MNHMKRFYKLGLRYLLIPVLLLVFSGEAFAKRVLGYTPPPFYIRFFISLFTLLPVGLVSATLCYFEVRLFDPDNCIKNRKTYFAIVLLLVLCGSLTAPIDSYNDELWNPAMIGAISLSLIMPTATLILQKKIRLWVTIIISLALIIPSMIVFEVVTFYYQMFGANIGIPTTW